MISYFGLEKKQITYNNRLFTLYFTKNSIILYNYFYMTFNNFIKKNGCIIFSVCDLYVIHTFSYLTIIKTYKLKPDTM